MKRFTEYFKEDFDPAIFNADGGISITDPSVLDAINSNLELSTGCDCRTPYIALEEVRKVLSYYKIFLPKSVFLDQNHGNDVFEVSQFGEKMGMNNQGEVVSANNSSLFVYFEWSLNEKGMYDTFAAIVDQDELDEILADYDSEVESDEDIQEEVMPDLKKKMGAKKVTLPNMMRKEETVNEIADTAKGKEAVRRVMHRADATAVDSAINPPRSKKGKREAKNAMKTIDRGIAVHKKKGGVLDNYLKRSYGIKNEETLNELHGKSKGALKAIKDRIEKKHDQEWEATHEKRAKEKLKGSEGTKKEDKSRNDLAKRWLRADKAEKKLKESSDTPPWRRKGEKPSGESKTPDAESKSKIKKITKRLAKMGMAKKK